MPGGAEAEGGRGVAWRSGILAPMRFRVPWAVWICLATLPACHRALPVRLGDAAAVVEADGDAMGADASAARIADVGLKSRDGAVPGSADDGASELSDGASEAGAASLCGGVVQLAAGLLHVCAVRSDQTLWCWGGNGHGQLGDGTSVGKTAPVQVAAVGTGVVQVAAGYNFTCARKRDGTLWCWGDNQSGELGNSGSTAASTPTPAPVAALGSEVIDVSARGEQVCARKADKSLWCWGSGYLGDGTAPKVVTSPTQVASLGPSVASVSVGTGDVCAVLVNGALWCWGDNLGGQLGDGSTRKSLAPLEVIAMGHEVATVACGPQDTCATKTDGTAWCWGWRSGTATPSPFASLGSGVVQIAASEGHMCARKADSTLWCWGGNLQGQVGKGISLYEKTPIQVDALGPTVDVVVGSAYTCAVLSDATLRCWGANDYGQIGMGTTSTRTVPYAVTLGQGTAQLAAGRSFFCARKADGSLWCWGDDPATLLADGSPVYQPNPVAVTTLGVSVTQVAAGDGDAACAILAGSEVWCWGTISNSAGVFDVRPAPFQVTGLPASIVGLAVGWGHACARAGGGTLWCWGRNDEGQLGIGTDDFFLSAPAQVSALGTDVTSVATSEAHTCARTGDGRLWCWGDNSWGQLGDGTTNSSTVPVAVTALGTGVVQASTGYASNTCAILDDGSAWCWGDNSDGQLGNGTTVASLVPARVSGLAPAVQISVSGSHTCAVTADGSLWCWGTSSAGQLGIGSGGQSVRALTPVQVAALGKDMAEVCAGNGSTCARDKEGSVWCWGSRDFGMMGDGTIGSVLTPTAPAGCE